MLYNSILSIFAFALELSVIYVHVFIYGIELHENNNFWCQRGDGLRGGRRYTWRPGSGQHLDTQNLAATLHWSPLHCTTLHYIALHFTTLHYIALHCTKFWNTLCTVATRERLPHRNVKGCDTRLVLSDKVIFYWIHNFSQIVFFFRPGPKNQSIYSKA